MADDDAPETRRLKASLATLAKTDESAVIEQAVAAIEDISAAAEFVESVGLDRLELAVTTVDDPALEERGKLAIEAFQRFQNAVDGSEESADNVNERFQFHCGRGTTINDAGERPAE